MKARFEIIFLETARVYLKRLPEKARKKIIFNIDKARFVNDPKLFKKLDKDIWEFRTRYSNHQYRLFAFWDKTNKANTLVITTHGIIKKSNKISKSEIEKAEKIRVQYFKEMSNEKET